MKKFAISLLVALAAPLGAAAQNAALDGALSRTDAVLAAEFARAAQDMTPFTVPPPVSISDGRYTDTPAADYLPLDKKAVYEYEYTSSEFTGVKVVRVEFLDYSDAEKSVRINMVIFNKTKPKVSNFSIASTPAGISASDSPLYGPRVEIPFPLTYNMTWNEGSDRSRVAALNAKVTVPAGTYNGCLKIVTRLGGGDAGSAERDYAPGVGLVYEQVNAEDHQETIKLTSYQLK